MKITLFLSSIILYSACYFGDASECLVEGTLVNTPEGAVPIEELQVGNHISSFSTSSGEVKTGVIVATEVHHNRRDVFRILLEDDTFVDATSDHKFMTGPTYHRTRVTELKPGTIVHKWDSEKHSVNRLAIVKIEKIANILPVYNLVVRNDQDEDYYFAADLLTADY